MSALPKAWRRTAHSLCDFVGSATRAQPTHALSQPGLANAAQSQQCTAWFYSAELGGHWVATRRAVILEILRDSAIGS